MCVIGHTVGPFGRMKLYHIKRQYDSSTKPGQNKVEPYVHTPGRVDKTTAFHYMREMARVSTSVSISFSIAFSRKHSPLIAMDLQTTSPEELIKRAWEAGTEDTDNSAKEQNTDMEDMMFCIGLHAAVSNISLSISPSISLFLSCIMAEES